MKSIGDHFIKAYEPIVKKEKKWRTAQEKKHSNFIDVAAT